VLERLVEVEDGIVALDFPFSYPQPFMAHLVEKGVAKDWRSMLHGTREFLKKKLPEYMMPSDFVELPVLPLTPNGKVDRRALAAQNQSRVIRNQEYTEPRTETEKAVAVICGDVIGIERVGVHDNFFELGGHSLIAMQVVSRLRESFQVDVTLRDLFENPTVSQLSEVINRAGRDDQESRITPTPVQESYHAAALALNTT